MRTPPSERLHTAVTKLREAQSLVYAAYVERDAAIVADLNAGVMQVDIVRATGINREQIRRIAKAIREEQA